MKRLALVVPLVVVAFAASGCYATKVVSLPMRVVGAATSLVPFVGNSAHDAIDGAADAVDDAL